MATIGDQGISWIQGILQDKPKNDELMNEG